MVNQEQIEEFEKIVGKCVRLCAWIEYQVSIFHANDKTKNMWVGLYQDKNFNICIDKKAENHFLKTWKEAENDSFNNSLKSLIKNDKDCEIFTKKQYMVLEQIRNLRNDVFHNSMCLYLDSKHYDGKEIDEYNTDLKKAKKLASLAEQYKSLISRKIENNFKKSF